jgi:hypothetical protein
LTLSSSRRSASGPGEGGPGHLQQRAQDEADRRGPDRRRLQQPDDHQQGSGVETVFFYSCMYVSATYIMLKSSIIFSSNTDHGTCFYPGLHITRVTRRVWGKNAHNVAQPIFVKIIT